eukprot:scaffold293_cov121-Isochrysis_galbana.AAC.9
MSYALDQRLPRQACKLRSHIRESLPSGWVVLHAVLRHVVVHVRKQVENGSAPRGGRGRVPIARA